MKYLLLLLLTLSVNLCSAQFLAPLAETEFFKFGDWNKESKTAIIFADVCNVRSGADGQSEVLGKLTIGTSVQIVEVSNTKHTQAGISAPWVKIKSAAHRVCMGWFINEC